ncbi:flagellin [Anaerocolumna aminovalerica]|uniref:Flagellin n=1 Tax=Anaerocolumna aminovalerica TaxID=1527 RepID=A0A1I5DMN9_9FIRM|nr:flagellin [Anaerocolumna aminovalerica]MBU5332240.1 flagellin [Anaerocolumna aminovalerica]SFO00397.1 flagellin [Anaerocolumna aminovalerica]
MVIQHNMAAANTNRQLGITTGRLGKSTEKLSSGYKINRAGDNAAGLSISEKMRGQIRGLDQASVNAQDGISLIQTAEGALNETHAILQRMRELTVQASNDTNASEDRDAIQKELTQLTTEVNRIANETEFNTKKLMNGELSGASNILNLQVGANKGQNISFNIGDMRASSLGVKDVATGVASYASATANISVVDAAIKKVSDQRSTLGALQNRLEHTIANADNTSENLQAAESRIRDVDMAKEMVKYSKDNILQQAAQSMLAQANQSTQGVLSLLQ